MEEKNMAFCGKCGKQVSDDVKFCSGCGASIGAEAAQPAAPVKPNAFQRLNNTADTTEEFTAQDISDNKAMAVLSYFGPLVLIPWLAAPQSKFARYHAKQGVVLCLLAVAYAIISAILCAIIKVDYTLYGWNTGIKVTPGWLTTILWLISIPICILAIMGIVNAVQGKAKELPVIGKIKLMK